MFKSLKLTMPTNGGKEKEFEGQELVQADRTGKLAKTALGFITIPGLVDEQTGRELTKPHFRPLHVPSKLGIGGEFKNKTKVKQFLIDISKLTDWTDIDRKTFYQRKTEDGRSIGEAVKAVREATGE